METSRTYTLSELESRSGFDKRTISYYIQEGLLPKVGRRGPKSRYPEEVLDRLVFIRRVRDLQDAGELRAVTLSEIRNVLDYLPSLGVRTGKQASAPVEFIRDLFGDSDGATELLSMPAGQIAATEIPSWDESSDSTTFDAPTGMASMHMRRSQMRERAEPSLPAMQTSLADEAPPPSLAARETPEEELQHLGKLLREIQQRAEVGADDYDSSSREHLIRVPIADDIRLSVRNLGTDDAYLADELAALLKRVMGG
jgi:DNA-binding transcriptional MerR regulator